MCASFSPESPERKGLYLRTERASQWRICKIWRNTLCASPMRLKKMQMRMQADMYARVARHHVLTSDALETRIVGQPLQRVRVGQSLSAANGPAAAADVEGRTVEELRRIGKRIAIGVEGDLWLVLHLMIAGRLHWRPRDAKLAGRQNLAAFDFPNGSLVLTEAGSKHRASLHLVSGEEALRAFDAGGIDVFASDLDAFRAVLTAENHTLKRALTDPRLLSGIGNAYSDEILHAAQLSPITLTNKLAPDEWERLFAATRQTLQLWINSTRC